MSTSTPSQKATCSRCQHPRVEVETLGWGGHFIVKRDDRGKPCRKCGYEEMRELPPIAIVFCNKCGCNYTNGCPEHG